MGELLLRLLEKTIERMKQEEDIHPVDIYLITPKPYNEVNNLCAS